jgi:hypothetical protein
MVPFSLWFYSPIQALATSMKLSVALQILDLGQLVGLLGRVISSSQGLYLYTNTEKRAHNTNTKHPCPEWAVEPTVPVSTLAKTVHALDRSAAVTGTVDLFLQNLCAMRCIVGLVESFSSEISL